MRRIALALLTILVAACGSGESRKEDHLQKGNAFLAERNYAKARVEFRNALQIDPADTQARALAGLASERMGEFEDAAGFYQATLDLDPANELARTNLARMLLGGGAPDQALELLAPGLERNPKSAKPISVRAAALASTASASADFAAARKDADSAYAIDPKDPEVIAVRVSLMWRAGERDSALELLDGAIAADADDVDLRDMRVQLSLLNGDLAAAEEGLVEILKHRPSSVEQRNRLAQVYLVQNKIDPAIATLRGVVAQHPRSIAAKIAFVGVLAERRSYAAAERELQDFIKAAPGNYDLQLEAGRFYESQERHDQARVLYHTLAIEARGKSQAATARNRLALLAIRDGDTKMALELVEQVLAENPADGEALVTRSQLALDRGDTQTAVTDLRTALRDRPDSVPLATALARAYLQSGDVTLAEQVLREAVRANPTNADAKLALAQFFVNEGRGTQATPLLEQLVAEQPTNAVVIEALFRQQIFTRDSIGAERTAVLLAGIPGKRTTGQLFSGLALEGQQRYDDARKAYVQAAADNPASIEPIVALARLEASRGNPEAALAQLDRGLARQATLRKDGMALLHLRGDVLLGVRGREREATQAYAEAVRLAPSSPGPWRGQAAALGAAGDPVGAMQVLERAMEATNGSSAVTIDLASSYRRAGRLPEAESIYEQVLRNQPANVFAKNGLAMTLLADPTSPLRIARALELAAPLADSRDPGLIDTWGWALHRAGRHAEAVLVLRKAAGMAPNAAEIRSHLALAELAASGEQTGGQVPARAGAH